VLEIFISYSRSMERQAVRIDAALQALGYSVWRDDQLLPNRPYLEDTQARLEEAKAVLVLWSKEAAKSQWVRSEANQARERKKIVQATLDGALPPMPFDQIQCARLQGWDGDPSDREWRNVLTAIAELVPRARRSRMADPAPSEAAAARRAPALRRTRWRLAAAAAAVLAVAVAGVLLWRWLAPTQPTAASARIAVLPFDAAGSGADAQRFAAGLSDEILSVLSANQAQVVSRTESAALHAPDAAAIKRLGAALLIDGTVDETADRMKVRMHLDDAASRTILWSEDFERPVAESEPLQAEVASKATTMAVYAQQAKAAGLSNPVVADYIAATEHIRFDWIGGMQAAEPILRRVVERAPRFSGGHASLAATMIMRPGVSAEQKAEAVREAKAALALDRGGFGAWAILGVLTPATDRQARLALFDKGLALDSADAAIPFLAGGELAQTGQLKAAAEMARRAVALDPLWPGANWSLGLRLLETGHESEGFETFGRMARLWPSHGATRLGRLWATTMYGDPDKARALLDDPKTRPDYGLDERGPTLFRTFLEATETGDAAQRARAAAALEAGERVGALDPGMATAMLARLGDLDGAFAAANRYADQVGQHDFTEPAYLFVSATAPLRRDPRFWPLAARLGLSQYWRTTGHWPDFCSEPGLPYDCKVEAAKVAAAAKS
jgi:TolB-like protein